MNERYDIIGDIHGCFEECVELLGKCGYQIISDQNERYGFRVINPKGRKAIFVGDICDRGPRIVDSFRLVMTMVKHQQAMCVLGNHEAKLLKKLNGRNVQIKNGLENTLSELAQAPVWLVEDIKTFVTNLKLQLVLDQGRLVVAHAGLPEQYHGKEGKAVYSHALFGDVSGKTDQDGYPIRRDWTLNYHGRAIVVYGHVPKTKVYESNQTFGIDTGCVFGGMLCCLRYPEMEIVAVKAKRIYSSHPHFDYLK